MILETNDLLFSLRPPRLSCREILDQIGNMKRVDQRKPKRAFVAPAISIRLLLSSTLIEEDFVGLRKITTRVPNVQDKNVDELGQGSALTMGLVQIIP